MGEQVAVKVTVNKDENSTESHESLAQRIKEDLEKAGHVVAEVALFPLVIATGIEQD